MSIMIALLGTGFEVTVRDIIVEKVCVDADVVEYATLTGIVRAVPSGKSFGTGTSIYIRSIPSLIFVFKSSSDWIYDLISSSESFSVLILLLNSVFSSFS